MKNNEYKNIYFKLDCKVINLVNEYGSELDGCKYAIATDLSEEELETKYPDQIKDLKPFIILTREMGKAFGDYWSNEFCAIRRYKRGDVPFDNAETKAEEELGLYVLDDQTLHEHECEEESSRQKVRTVSSVALRSLTPLQSKYLYEHYVNDKSIRLIAKEDGKSYSTVKAIIDSAVKKYIRACDDNKEDVV